MSLHIGNLSSHIGTDDLERVFRRFGRCSIRVKDKYGFAVFDYPASAEKALKALRGTRICGEELTLSWSKHQPHAPQRFSTGGKFYKQPFRKYTAKGNGDQMLGSSDLHDFGVDFKNAEGRAIGCSDLIDESTSYHPDDVEHYVGERDPTCVNDYRGSGGAGKNYLEDDRWEEQIADPSNESYLENGLEFDRYEPGHSVGAKELNEHQATSPVASSPNSRKAKDRAANIYRTQSQNNCYLCGEVGHKMRYCPLELRRRVPRSHGRMRPGGDNVPFRYQESGRSQFPLANRRRLLRRGDSPHLHDTLSNRGKEFRNKQRSRRNYESTDKNHSERADGPSSPSIHSGYTSSRSRSPSRRLRSLPQPPSPSKPSKEDSPPSSLKSSPSYHSEPKSIKSSTSRSMSPASFDLNRQLSPPSNKLQTEFKDSVAHAAGLSHHTDLFEDNTLVRSRTGTSTSENLTCEVENECGTMKNLSEKDNVNYHTVSKDSYDMFESYEQQLDANDHFAKQMLPHRVSDTRDSKDEHARAEHMLTFESDISVSSNPSNLERMSLEEVCLVLKNYGLKYSVENEKDVHVESYFGAARLWPWEMIYYRRLKKGSISAENYSRRIAQNEEYGIVDKYIRCSSGWNK